MSKISVIWEYELRSVIIVSCETPIVLHGLIFFEVTKTIILQIPKVVPTSYVAEMGASEVKVKVKVFLKLTDEYCRYCQVTRVHPYEVTKGSFSLHIRHMAKEDAQWGSQESKVCSNSLF